MNDCGKLKSNQAKGGGGYKGRKLLGRSKHISVYVPHPRLFQPKKFFVSCKKKRSASVKVVRKSLTEVSRLDIGV